MQEQADRVAQQMRDQEVQLEHREHSMGHLGAEESESDDDDEPPPLG